jgi:hypothetical protein
MCQHSDTAQCKVTGNSKMIHTECCYFDAPLYLISPLLAECESTSVIDNNSNTYSSNCYSRPTLPVGTINLMMVSFTPLSLYLPVLLERRLCGLLFRFASLGQEKFLLPLLDIDLISLSFPACSLVTILTELSQLPLAPLTQLI